jgi:hypothetical protein
MKTRLKNLLGFLLNMPLGYGGLRAIQMEVEEVNP